MLFMAHELSASPTESTLITSSLRLPLADLASASTLDLVSTKFQSCLAGIDDASESAAELIMDDQSEVNVLFKLALDDLDAF